VAVSIAAVHYVILIVAIAAAFWLLLDGLAEMNRTRRRRARIMREDSYIRIRPGRKGEPW